MSIRSADHERRRTAGSSHPGFCADEPAELIQSFVKQGQLLASLQWLGAFQILARIPLQGVVAYTSLADLTGVPAAQIRRVVRMSSSAGFLREPQQGTVAHTALSSAFVLRPSLLDCIMFIAETLVPSALSMPKATRQDGVDGHAGQPASPYQLATKSLSSIGTACDGNPRLRRQLEAFSRLAAPAKCERVQQLLKPLDWESLGPSVVLEVNARSNSTTQWLASRDPKLQFILQAQDQATSRRLQQLRRQSITPGKLTYCVRAPGSPQAETTANVYLLHLPDPLFSLSSAAYVSLCRDELRIHFEILGVNKNATLILIADVCPGMTDPGSHPDPDACLRDLLLLQSGHEDAFDHETLSKLVESVSASTVQPAVVAERISASGSTVVLVLRARPPISLE